MLGKHHVGLRLGFLALWLVFFSPATGVMPRAATPPTTPGQEGQALAANLCARRPAQDFNWEGVLSVKTRSGQVAQIPVTLEVKLEPGGWRDVYEASVTNGGFREKLVIIHEDPGVIRYLRARGRTGEPLGELAPVSAEQLCQSFAQTDFSLLDLGLDFFRWPGQAVVRKEIRRTRDCIILDSIPAAVSPAGYSRVRSWVDKEEGGVLDAEAYDYQQNLLKKFSVNKIAKVNGQYRVKELEIRNLLTGSRTRLKFDLPMGLDSPK